MLSLKSIVCFFVGVGMVTGGESESSITPFFSPLKAVEALQSLQILQQYSSPRTHSPSKKPAPFDLLSLEKKLIASIENSKDILQLEPGLSFSDSGLKLPKKDDFLSQNTLTGQDKLWHLKVIDSDKKSVLKSWAFRNSVDQIAVHLIPILQSRIKQKSTNPPKYKSKRTYEFPPCLKLKTDNTNFKKSRLGESGVNLPRFPEYTPVVGVRALSNLEVFFANVYENLVALHQSKARDQAGSKRHGLPANKPECMALQAIRTSSESSEDSPRNSMLRGLDQETSANSVSSLPHVVPDHHPLKILFKDQQASQSQVQTQTRLKPWDRAWKWSSISLGKRKQ